MGHSTSPNHLIAVYRTNEQAISAIRLLTNTGHETKNLSLIGQDSSTGIVPRTSARRRQSREDSDACRISNWELLCGSALMFMPGLGYVKFGGWLVDGLEEAVVGGSMSVLGDTLANIGIPNARFVRYRKALEAGRFLLFVHGNEDEVRRAKSALPRTDASEIASYTSNHDQQNEASTPNTAPNSHP